MKTISRLLIAASVLAVAGSAHANDWYPFAAAKIEPPFAEDGTSEDVTYTPSRAASSATP